MCYVKVEASFGYATHKEAPYDSFSATTVHHPKLVKGLIIAMGFECTVCGGETVGYIANKARHYWVDYSSLYSEKEEVPRCRICLTQVWFGPYWENIFSQHRYFRYVRDDLANNKPNLFGVV